MRITEVFNTLENWLRCLVCWVRDFFNPDPAGKPKQLIPVEIDAKKRPKPFYHQDYDSNLLKMMLIIIATIIMMLIAGRIATE